jgi:hypothetical protein
MVRHPEPARLSLPYDDDRAFEPIRCPDSIVDSIIDDPIRPAGYRLDGEDYALPIPSQQLLNLKAKYRFLKNQIARKIGQTPWEITHRLDVRDMKIDEQEELDKLWAQLDEHKAQIRALKG